MKIASMIFIIIGMVCSPYAAATSSLGILYTLIMSVLAIGFGIIGIVALSNNYKKTWLGIFIMVFTNLLGGIFYLCWKPVPAKEEPVQKSFEEVFKAEKDNSNDDNSQE